jgi:YggT family protein
LRTSLLESGGYVFWLLVNVYIWVIVIAAVASWFSPDRGSPFVRLLDRLTRPALRLARRFFRLSFGGLDFSPLLVILVLYFVAELARLSTSAIAHGAQPMVILPIAVICLVQLVKSLCWFIFLLMAVRVIMSLVRPNPYNPFVLIVYGATEPLLSPFKGYVPRGPWNLDIGAVLFLAFLLLFDVLVLDNILKATVNWGSGYGGPSVR